VDIDLVHACVHGDLTISEEDRGMKVFIEGIVRGQRRLHLFANTGDVAPGWLHVGSMFRSMTSLLYLRFFWSTHPDENLNDVTVEFDTMIHGILLPTRCLRCPHPQGRWQNRRQSS
jgi:hypothetical protein